MGRIETPQSEPPPGFGENDPISLGVKQLASFLPGGAVERLGEWAYRVLRVHVPVQDYLYENGRAILAELEALLPKRGREKDGLPRS